MNSLLIFINRKDFKIFLSIFLLAAVKYFYQALEINPFEIDQEFLSLEAWKIIKLKKLTLIGAQTSVGDIFIGPIYTYLVTLTMLLTRLHPYTVNLLSALFASLVPPILFAVGKKLYSQTVGLVAGIISALSIEYLTLSSVPPLVIPSNYEKIKSHHVYGDVGVALP